MPKSNPVSAMPLANCPFNEAKPNVASLLTAQPPAVGSEAKLKLLAVSVIGPSDTIKGISKPGHIIWSRVYVQPDGLKADLGLAESVELPREETERRWQITTPQWPMMHTVFPGITRDQFMARHCSNHIQVAYGPDEAQARNALAAKAAMFQSMGIDTYFCGDVGFAR